MAFVSLGISGYLHNPIHPQALLESGLGALE